MTPETEGAAPRHGGEEKSEAPRAARRPKKHAAHGGAWKVAYADFVTAMLALFIVLWVMAQGEEIRRAVQAYFKDPVEFTKTGGRAVIGAFKESAPPSQMSEEDAAQAMAKKMEAEIMRIRELLSASEQLEKIADQIFIELTPEGIRMELRDASKFSFFGVGSAAVSRELKEILHILAPEIARLPYPVAIEGHTDRRPYGTANYTNWELSADRGNSVRRVMLDAGLPAEKITEVRACADTRLLNTQDPFALENRRVSILLKNPLFTGTQ